MQPITHKNSHLTICERFFIEKSLELLYIGSIDSDRVRLHNPKTILEEIKYCLQEFQIGRIKHFKTIKAKEKEKKAIIDEALLLLKSNPNYLTFDTISQKYLEQLLNTVEEHNFKKLIPAIGILLETNQNYLNNVIDGLESLISTNNTTLVELEKIDISLNILFSELVNVGFSKVFLSKLVHGIFVNTLSSSSRFSDHFSNFKTRILLPKSEYEVIFRIDTTPKVYDSISAISNSSILLSDDINNVRLSNTRESKELRVFNITSPVRKFIRCIIEAPDHFAALKKARSTFSEYLDIINLGLSDEFLLRHDRALVIDSRSPQNGAFQNNVNILDGKYTVEKEHYLEFTRKLPAILNSSNIQGETKEKIKSAIRYLRLGNQSTEVEHKFINYWIGLEYLFSNYESLDTINRIKEHFIIAHSLAYVKRNAFSFKRKFEQASTASQTLVPSYTSSDNSCLELTDFYLGVGQHLLNIHPLIAYHALKLHRWFFPANKPANVADYIKKHKTNLEIHFTRIYRLRNEIIHDAATNTNNEHIASNLRYYLTFILNEIIDFLSKNTTKPISIEDYFIFNEIAIGNIELSGYLLKDLLDVECSIEFIS